MRESPRVLSYLYSFLLRVGWALDSVRERLGLTLYTALRCPTCGSSHVGWAAERDWRNVVCHSCGHAWKRPEAKKLTTQ